MSGGGRTAEDVLAPGHGLHGSGRDQSRKRHPEPVRGNVEDRSCPNHGPHAQRRRAPGCEQVEDERFRRHPFFITVQSSPVIKL